MTLALTTDRLTLLPRTLRDMQACLDMDRDLKVTKYIHGPWQDPPAHRAFLEARMAEVHPEPLGYWSIFERAAPEVFLGWVMMLPGAKDAEAEIGWRLTHASWGRGIATEAVACALKHLHERRPEMNLIATIHPENLGSVKVAKKCGFEFERQTSTGGVLQEIFRLGSAQPKGMV